MKVNRQSALLYFNKILQTLKIEYNLLSDKKIKRILCFVFPVYMFVFLVLFKPFNLNLTENTLQKYFIIFLYSFSGTVIWFIHLYVLFKNKKKFTIGKTIIILFWIHLCMGIAVYMIHEIALGHKPFVLSNLPILVFWVFLASIIPIAFVLITYKSNLIKSEVKIVNRLNQNLCGISAGESSKSISIESDTDSTFLNIPEGNILYFLAAGNYVDVYYLEDNLNVKHYLIRNTLSNIQLQVNKQSGHLIRCHNSYIINTMNISRINGNSAAYKAVLKHSKQMVPVSKKYKDELFSIVISK